ncbi:MAG: hypothetical protein NTY19_11745 [Planctomycetota bacterium]|nr:hypothetical protein [Planctomycetota bacterium]
MLTQPQDPLGRDLPLSHSVELPVLGLWVRFETSHPAVLAAVVDSFGPLPEGGVLPACGSRVAARVQVFVQDGEEGAGGHAPIRYRSPNPQRLLVTTPASLGVAELDRKEAYAYVSQSLLADARHFQFGMLETLTLVLVAGTNRQPVHAALLAEQGVGLLLIGNSGSGKSSLTYAAARSGICALGEDVAYVQREPEFRIWAAPRRIHLLPEAASFFPELAGRPTTRLPSGKNKIVVGLDRTRACGMNPVAKVGVCLLEKGTGLPRVQEARPTEVEQVLNGQLEPGFDFFREGAPNVGRLVSNRALRCWRLCVSPDPRESVPLLGGLLADLAALVAPTS